MTKNRGINYDWSVGELRRLGRYIRCGLTYREMALLFNVSRNAVIGIAARHGLKYTAEQALERKQRANYERTKGGRAPQWNTAKSERQFIEPWAEYSARKKAERVAAKALSCTSQDVSQSPAK